MTAYMMAHNEMDAVEIYEAEKRAEKNADNSRKKK
jgi:hypothetical protein